MRTIKFRPEGLDAGVIFIKTILEQIIDIAFHPKGVRAQRCDAANRASQGFQGIDKFVIIEVLDAFHDNPPAIGLLLGGKEVLFCGIEILVGARFRTGVPLPGTVMANALVTPKLLPQLFHG